MNSNQRIKLQFNLKDHEFLITLQLIKCHKEIEGVYTLQLYKGCRHLKSVNEPISFDKNRTYLFYEAKPITVRAYKQKNMNFQWSLYKHIQDKYKFVDTFHANFHDHYLNFLHEIHNSSFQYLRIYQQKDKGQPLGKIWKQMKSQLKGHHFKQTIKSSSGDLLLQFGVEIRNEFDRMTEAQAQKNNMTIESELEVGSNSVQNQAKSKKKVRIMQEQTEKQIIQSVINCEQLQPKQENKVLIQSYHQTQTKIQHYHVLPIQEASSKPKTILSDIVQASQQGESHQHIGDKSDGRPSQSLIELPKSAKPFFITKTQESDNSEPIIIKRTNSHKNIRVNHEYDDENQLLRVSEVTQGSKDELTKESTLIYHRQPQVKHNFNQIVQSNTKRYVLIVFVLYIVFGSLLLSQMKGNLAIKRQFSLNTKIKKDRLSIDKSFLSLN